MKCPICHGNTVGKVGNNQFYCWECHVEYSYSKNSLQIYEVDDDGSLIPIEVEEAKPIPLSNELD